MASVLIATPTLRRIAIWTLSASVRRAYAPHMPLPCAGYQPRDAERGVLYQVVDAHLDAFLDAAAHHAEGTRLPAFVEQEFRGFLTCAVLAHGFARLRCGECAFDALCPFPAKGAGSARAAGAGV